MGVPWVRAQAIAMGFRVPLTRDPLLWIVLAVAAGGAAYQGLRKDGAWALADFIFGVYALGSLTGWTRRRLARSKGDQYRERDLWVFRRPLVRDWLFGACLLVAVIVGLIGTWSGGAGAGWAIGFFAPGGFLLAAVVIGSLRSFVEGYRQE